MSSNYYIHLELIGKLRWWKEKQTENEKMEAAQIGKETLTTHCWTPDWNSDRIRISFSAMRSTLRAPTHIKLQQLAYRIPINKKKKKKGIKEERALRRKIEMDEKMWIERRERKDL